MNANELADKIEDARNETDFQIWAGQAPDMLRQQQAEIEQCKREIDELYESLKEALNNHKITHLHPFWIEYRKRKAQEKLNHMKN